MKYDISTLASQVHQNENGIWFSGATADVSYYRGGHDLCFAIEEDSFWFHHRNQCIVTLLQSFPPNDQTVFDIGGGNGFVAKRLQQADYDVVVVEPIVDGAENAHSAGIRHIICSPLEAIGFRESSLPSVGMFDVLEHIEDDVAQLRLIFRLLQPGGRLYLTVPAFPWLWSVEDVVAGHFRRYTVNALTRVLAEANFSLEHSSYFFSYLTPPLFLLRTVPSAVGLRKHNANRNHGEHAMSSSKWSNYVLAKCNKWERGKIANAKRIPFGTSCIAVARKEN